MNACAIDDGSATLDYWLKIVACRVRTAEESGTPSACNPCFDPAIRTLQLTIVNPIVDDRESAICPSIACRHPQLGQQERDLHCRIVDGCAHRSTSSRSMSLLGIVVQDDWQTRLGRALQPGCHLARLEW